MPTPAAAPIRASIQLNELLVSARTIVGCSPTGFVNGDSFLGSPETGSAATADRMKGASFFRSPYAKAGAALAAAITTAATVEVMRVRIIVSSSLLPAERGLSQGGCDQAVKGPLQTPAAR
jgi:hypothetical protein